MLNPPALAQPNVGRLQALRIITSSCWKRNLIDWVRSASVKASVIATRFDPLQKPLIRVAKYVGGIRTRTHAGQLDLVNRARRMNSRPIRRRRNAPVARTRNVVVTRASVSIPKGMFQSRLTDPLAQRLTAASEAQVIHMPSSRPPERKTCGRKVPHRSPSHFTIP